MKKLISMPLLRLEGWQKEKRMELGYKIWYEILKTDETFSLFFLSNK